MGLVRLHAMSSSVTYRQLILRLPEGLKEAMRSRIATDAGLDGIDFSPVKKGSRRYACLASPRWTLQPLDLVLCF